MLIKMGHKECQRCDCDGDCCKMTKVEDESLLWASIVQCGIFTDQRKIAGDYKPPTVYNFNDDIYNAYINFGNKRAEPQYFSFPTFYKTLVEEWYEKKGTLELYKDPEGDSIFMMNQGGATKAEIDIRQAFALAGTPDNKKNYLIIQENPAYDAPAQTVTIYDTPNVWNLMYERDGTEVEQINAAIANLNAGLTVNGGSPLDLSPPRSTPTPGDYEIIEWIIQPNNPSGANVTVNHALDDPVGAVGWTGRSIFVADFAFCTPAYQQEDDTDVVQAGLDLVREIRANPDWALLTFPSISKQLGLTSQRVDIVFIPQRWAERFPSWNAWYNKISRTNTTCVPIAMQDFFNRIQYEIDTDLGVEMDKEFNEINKRIQRAVLSELETAFPGKVSLISKIGGPVIYLDFDPSVYESEGFSNMASYFTSLYGVTANNGANYTNNPNPILPRRPNEMRLATANGAFVFTAVLNRIAGFNKYKPEDFLIYDRRKTNKVVIEGKRCKQVEYLVNINDDLVIVNPRKGDVTVTLPNLQSFFCTPKTLKIKNVARCKGCVTVKSSETLEGPKISQHLGPREYLKVRWSANANLSDGEWIVIQ